MTDAFLMFGAAIGLLALAFAAIFVLGRIANRSEPPTPAHACSRCSAVQLVRVNEYPEKGTGCIVAILGLVLSPLLLGIPLVFYGLHLHGKIKSHWHCRGCGTVFPA